MHLPVKYFTAILLIAGLVFLINSCQKDQPACKGNCANITIKGIVYLKTNGTGLTNVPVEAIWFKNSLCLGCTSYRVVSGKTFSDGSFGMNATIDTSFFKDYFLSVRVPADTNFICFPVNGGSKFPEIRFYDFTSFKRQNIEFDFYSKAPLTINLHRTQNDTFDYFSVDHFFTGNFGYGDIVVTGPSFAKDTSLKVTTASDIATKITWKKTIIGGPLIQQEDSLVCTKNGTNVLNINY
jgi:hypothetical protein